MEYALDLQSRSIVAAAAALSWRKYACPRPGCGGRVYLPEVVVQRPHFRHYPGEGTSACDEYFPGDGTGKEHENPAIAAVEEDPAELGLLLTQIDGVWGLGLRLPEIPNYELGETPLAALRSAHIDVYENEKHLRQISALELRPGVGIARVDVIPTSSGIRTQASGLWPASIKTDRWNLESRGLESNGTLFRLRLGEWMRLTANSGVHHGESLLVLADKRYAPPVSIISELHARIANKSQWTIWEVRLPDDDVAAVTNWLGSIGHNFIPRPWTFGFATPARVYGDNREPVYWTGDTPVVLLEPPRPSATATVAFECGSNARIQSVQAPEFGFAYLCLGLRDAGNSRLTIAGDRTSTSDFGVIERPSSTSLRQLLAQTPRLRVQIGNQPLEAWQGVEHKVRMLSPKRPEVHIDLGDESVRARVTVWERGVQRCKPGLDSRGVARAIEDSLASADRVAIDAGNLGYLTLLPVREDENVVQIGKFRDRLAWRNRVVSLLSRTKKSSVPAILKQPQAPNGPVAEQFGTVSLISSRMTIRQRLESRGSRS